MGQTGVDTVVSSSASVHGLKWRRGPANMALGALFQGENGS